MGEEVMEIEEQTEITEDPNLEETLEDETLDEGMVEIDISPPSESFYGEDDDTDIEPVEDVDAEPVVDQTPAEPKKSDLEIMREMFEAQQKQHAEDMKALVAALKPKEEVKPQLTAEERYKQYFEEKEASALAKATSGLAERTELEAMQAKVAALEEKNAEIQRRHEVAEIERPHIEALQRTGYTPAEVKEILAEKDELVKVVGVRDPSHADKIFTLAEALWSKRRDKRTAAGTAAARAKKAQLQEQAGLPVSNGGYGRATIPQAELDQLSAWMDSGDPVLEEKAVRRFAALQRK